MPRIAHVLAVLLFSATLAAQAERPNIVYIFSDDHAEQAISAYGGRINRTPHIDRLAREGIVFTRSFCANSICAPSRATVLTGQHSHVNGKMTNGDRFDARRSRLPLALREAGYRTALFGKWHLQCDPVGFDDWEILPGQGHYYNPDFRSAKGRRRVSGHVTGIITDMALDWLRTRRSADQPFLLMVQHKAPHRNWMPAPEELDLHRDVEIPEPATLFDDWSERAAALARSEMSVAQHLFWHYDLKVPPALQAGLPGPTMKGAWARGEWDRMSPRQRGPFEEAYRAENEALAAARPQGRELVRWKYQRYIKDYLRCVAGVDRSVGVLLDELDRLGLAENTLVVYSSDQGFYLGEHGWYDKRWIFEESMRMPLLMRWPGRIAPGTRSSLLVQNIDHAPTLLDAAGVTRGRRGAEGGAVRYETMQGRSLLPMLDDPEAFAGPWREALYYAYYEVGIHAVEPHDGVRTKSAKIAWFPRSRTWQLFDLVEDPQELRDVSDLRPEEDPSGAARRLFARMTRIYAEQRHRHGADVWPRPSNLGVYDPRGVPQRLRRRVGAWVVHEDRRMSWARWAGDAARLRRALEAALAEVEAKLTPELVRRSAGLEVVLDVEASPHPEEGTLRDVAFSDGASRCAAHLAPRLEDLRDGAHLAALIGEAVAESVLMKLDADDESLLAAAAAAEYPRRDAGAARREIRDALARWIATPSRRGEAHRDWSPAMRELVAALTGGPADQRAR